MNRIFIGAVIATLIVAPAAAEDQKFFRGKMSNLIFCEGGDGELSLKGSNLSVDCADSHVAPVSISGNNITISNFYLDCRGWCGYLISVTGSDHSVTGNH